MEKIHDRLLVWGRDGIDWDTLKQANLATTLPFVPGHVALMPDAHRGIGATIGSVIPTEGAIVPSFAGVDLGCGMIATETVYCEEDLPDSLDGLMTLVAQAIPAGVGKGHEHSYRDGWRDVFGLLGEPHTLLTDKQTKTAISQFGTLGSGNHFVEVSLDERGVVWTVLHSGSRGIGNQLATMHIREAKADMKRRFITLDDPDLAYFVEDTDAFDAYITDMLWAQAYARENRRKMNGVLLRSLKLTIEGKHFGGPSIIVQTINCHHNYTVLEHHLGRDLWITRKGAIKADAGDMGVIPGSMGTDSYIVRGKGSAAAYNSSSHGAGRRMSRGQAKRELDIGQFRAEMDGRTWNADQATALLDEAPSAYKDIREVMAAQPDLTEIVHVLHQVFSYKGV